MQKNVVKTYIDKLQDLGILTDNHVPQDILNKQVDCLSYDTRVLFGNSIFICKGKNFIDQYAHDAINNGALLFISENKIDGLDNYAIVSDIRKAIEALAFLHFDNAPSKLQLVGITGTKGKSSITYILQGILNEYLADNKKPNCAIISSIDTYDGVQKFESHLTTPDVIELHQHFSNAVDSGITHLVMEVSSQALKYGRVAGVNFDVVCFTNFGKDHISEIEHPTVEDYFESKLKIFDHTKFACINSDMDQFQDVMNYAKDKCDVITYGTNKHDSVFCSNICSHGDRIDFHVKTDSFEKDMTLGMGGLFNVSNALAAIAICTKLNIDEKYISKGLENSSVPGRMKIITSKDKNLIIYVDYAHNELSFNALFKSLREEYPNSKMISIFGCPGGKAKDRREELPQIASKYCDNIIVCEEDSGPEPFEDIAKDIVDNISIENYEVIEDREEALKHAIFNLKEGQTVIAFTGKGEETRLKRGDNYDPCESDLSLALKYIEKYDNLGK